MTIIHIMPVSYRFVAGPLLLSDIKAQTDEAAIEQANARFHGKLDGRWVKLEDRYFVWEFN